MVSLSAKIQLIPNENQVKSVSIKSQHSKNNISSELSSVLNTSKTPGNPFLLGCSKFNDGSILMSSVDYFISKELSNSNGSLTNEFVIELKGKFDYLTIIFDTINNCYPNEIFYSEKVYPISKPVATLAVYHNSDEPLTLRFRTLNKKNRPIIIQGIYAYMDFDINYNNLSSANVSLYDRGTFNTVSFGIISNYGKISFKDKTISNIVFLGGVLYIISDLKNRKQLSKSKITQIFINNTITKSKQQIAEFYTGEWEYDEDAKIVSVSLVDDLLEWQSINIPQLNFSFENRDVKSFEYVYTYLYGLTPAKYGMLAFDELDEDTKSLLSKSYIKYLTISAGSLWSAWQKLCEVCQLHIFKSGSRTICKYNGGN